MRYILLILLQFITLDIAQATTLTCNWLKSPKHSPGFYQPAAFTLKLSNSSAKIWNDSFFYRNYEPCYEWSITSRCTFVFTYDKTAPWVLKKKNDKQISLRNTWYFTSVINLYFDRPYEELHQGETIPLLINGFDDNGTSIDNERFQCQVY